MLPPTPQAEVNAQLADVGFTKSKAQGNGDCYPLSAMAGFEISATAARQPRAGTTASVHQVREAAVGILAGDAVVDGIDAAVFRDGERLPVAADAAREAMTPWLESGFWNSADGHKFASFMLSVALHLERPVAVIERKGKTFLNPVRIYGARDANGALIHSTAKPNAPETVPTFKLVPFAPGRDAAHQPHLVLGHRVQWLQPFRPLAAQAIAARCRRGCCRSRIGGRGAC